MASRAPIAITRHYGELSEKETDAVVKAVANLIVGYLKTDRNPATKIPGDSYGAATPASEREGDLPF